MPGGAPRLDLPVSDKFLLPRNNTIFTYTRSTDSEMTTQTTANGFEQRIPHMQEKDLPGNANWVVQKYGGTSLGKFAVQIAEDIVV